MRIPSILVVIFVVGFDIASAWFIFKVYKARKQTYVRSRGPGPAIVSGVANILIVTDIFAQDICLLEGLIFPCVVNVLHYFVLVPIYVLGFVIRGLRVVILSSPELRLKMGVTLSTRGTLVWYFQNLVPMLIAMVVTISLPQSGRHYRHFQNEESCYFNQEIVFWAVFTATQVIMLSGLSMKLRQFGDKVHLAQELIPTFVFILFMVTLYLTIRSWSEWGGLYINSSAHLPLAVLHIASQFNTGTGKVHIDSDGPTNCSTAEDFKSVDQIMSNETIKCCFGHVVEKFLCGESYWFLNEVQEYKDMVDLPATARFEKIRSIQDAYIKQGSNFEINIETKMRNEAMKVSTLEEFERCSEEDQENVFTSSANEMRRLLGENVLKGFHKSAEFQSLFKNSTKGELLL